jgi:hypothetical protein
MTNYFADQVSGQSSLASNTTSDTNKAEQSYVDKGEGKSSQVNTFSGTFSTGGGPAFYGNKFGSGGGSTNF